MAKTYVGDSWLLTATLNTTGGVKLPLPTNPQGLAELVNMVEVSVIESTAESLAAVRYSRDPALPPVISSVLPTSGHRLKAGVYTFRGDVRNILWINETSSGVSLRASWFIDD